MKTTITNESEKKRGKYPCLKKNRFSGSVILFTSPGTGTQIHCDEGEEGDVGVHSTGWAEDICDLFTGELILKN